MKVVVVGGNGFVGRELVDDLRHHLHDVCVIGSELDSSSPEGRRKIMSALSASDAMVFLAAKRPVGNFEIKDYLYNIELAATYLECARMADVKNIVITSSRSVYAPANICTPEDNLGISDEQIRTERSFTYPLSLYGAAKQAVDGLALFYNSQYDMHIKCLRLAQVIGQGEHKGYLINTLIDNAIAGKPQTIYGMGVGRRQYIYVKDVCDAIRHCITQAPMAGGVYNTALPDNISIAEFAALVNDVFENKEGITFLKDKQEDTQNYLMDTTKMQMELQWSPRFDLRRTLIDMKESHGIISENS